MENKTVRKLRFPARSCLVTSLLMSVFGCRQVTEAPAQKVAPASVENGLREVDLTTIRLTTQAEARLGIETVAIRDQLVQETRTYGGEAVIPWSRSFTIAAPVAGTLKPGAGNVPEAGATIEKGQALFQLLPLESDLRGRSPMAEAEQNLGIAEARVTVARQRVQRAEQLLRDRAGSEKALEESQAELAQARAVHKGAQAQIEYLRGTALEAGQGLMITSPERGMLLRSFVTQGQSVAAGSPLFEVTRLDPMWVRVPVYVGELPLVQTSEPAVVHGLTEHAGPASRRAVPVSAPPSAHPETATVDLFYQLENPNWTLRPGQKLGVTLRLAGEDRGLVVPWSTVVHDIHGGAWLYEKSAPQTYVRRRVDVRLVDGSSAILSSGPAAGTEVVMRGAAELFGTEFGIGK